MKTFKKIRIGTSGYSFDDWKGTFYPPKLAKTKMLDFYVQHFNTVEINSTYYGIPHPRVFENMVKKTPDDFQFMIKAHSSVTHKRAELENQKDQYLEAIKPVNESSKLKGILAQFPWSFKRSEGNYNHLKKCRDVFSDYKLFIEFRHNSWLKQDTFDFLKAHDLGYVSVDAPKVQQMIENAAVVTNNTGYIRLHGRNAEQWWDGGALRYDYDYSDDELIEWTTKVINLEEKSEMVYIFFNNCHMGKAVGNAMRIMELLP